MVKNRLKEILEQRGIKQVWLAEKAGITKQTMSNIIANKFPTTMDTAFKICKALNLNINEVFYEDIDI